MQWNATDVDLQSNYRSKESSICPSERKICVANAFFSRHIRKISLIIDAETQRMAENLLAKWKRLVAQRNFAHKSIVSMASSIVFNRIINLIVIDFEASQRFAK